MHNIREIHFSRNTTIFEILHKYEYVKEFGENIERMFLENQRGFGSRQSVEIKTES